MFDNLSNRLQDIFKRLRGQGRLSQAQVEEAVREIRLALLEADVNFKVVKDVVERIKVKAVGEEVLQSLTSAQQVIKIVHDELTDLMGGAASKLSLAQRPPTVLMLIGLQGSGKTSAAAKLALDFRNKGNRPLLVAADIHRPAAPSQLKVLGDELGVPVLLGAEGEKAVSITKRALGEGSAKGYDVIVLDTAGRLHIDQKMMDELKAIKEAVHPHQILLVADAMIGQDAVNQALAFNEQIGFDGVILTKLDGDARGGAALSIKAVTGKPIKLVAVGEKPSDLDLFHPDRMASRILGMGDVMSLVEKAEAAVDQEKAVALEEKLRREEYTFEDFLVQMEEMKKMGSISDILKMLPGNIPGMPDIKSLTLSDKDLDRVKAIIQSMTPEERRKPRMIDGSRRARIARGSGVSTAEVNKLLKQFELTRKMLKKLARPGGRSTRGVNSWRLRFG